MGEYKEFNVEFKDKRQLGRSMMAKDLQEVEDYFKKKYPNRTLSKIEERIKKVEDNIL